MKNLKFKILESKPGSLVIPELSTRVFFELLSADLIQIGEGLGIVNTYLKIKDQTPLVNDMRFSGNVTNEVSDTVLDKFSEFKSEEPAYLLVQTDSGQRIELFSEPTVVRYSDKHINSLGAPLYNVTTMSGARFA